MDDFTIAMPEPAEDPGLKEALVDVSTAQDLRIAMPAITEILSKMDKEVDRRAQSCQNDNKLNGEKALQFYQERLAIKKLRTRINQIVRIGTSAGERIGEDMVIGGDNGEG